MPCSHSGLFDAMKLPRFPVNSEAHPDGETGREAFTLEIFPRPGKGDSDTRPLGRVQIRPGPVAPGKVAAVRMSDGSLTLRRIYYQREGGREMVNLESLLPDADVLRFPLSAVRVLGTVISCERI